MTSSLTDHMLSLAIVLEFWSLYLSTLSYVSCTSVVGLCPLPFFPNHITIYLYSLNMSDWKFTSADNPFKFILVSWAWRVPVSIVPILLSSFTFSLPCSVMVKNIFQPCLAPIVVVLNPSYLFVTIGHTLSSSLYLDSPYSLHNLCNLLTPFIGIDLALTASSYLDFSRPLCCRLTSISGAVLWLLLLKTSSFAKKPAHMEHLGIHPMH